MKKKSERNYNKELGENKSGEDKKRNGRKLNSMNKLKKELALEIDPKEIS